MDPNQIFDKVMTGSPWAFVFLLGWACYKLYSGRISDWQAIAALVKDCVETITKATEALKELAALRAEIAALRTDNNRMREDLLRSGKIA